MTKAKIDPIRIDVEGSGAVSGLWQLPPRPRACLVLAHGAGAGMAHKSMQAIADGLAERNVATLRYQFPYMERGGKRVDPPALAHATVRAAVDAAARLAPKLNLFAGGKSFGGRMTAQAQALEALPQVHGLVFFAFPLHPSKRPGVERAEHLSRIAIRMLFVQGTRDALAEIDLLRPVIARLGARATLKTLADADHAFHVPAKTGRTDTETLADALDATASWMGE